MVEKFTPEYVFSNMHPHKIEKVGGELFLIDDILFEAFGMNGRKPLIHEVGTKLYFDPATFSGFMLGKERLSPLSYGNFGTYPQCLENYLYWLERCALLCVLLSYIKN